MHTRKSSSGAWRSKPACARSIRPSCSARCSKSPPSILDRTDTSASRRKAVKRSSATPEDELPTLAYIAIAYLAMAAGWSVLFIAWPYLVDQVPPPERLLVERTWYGLRFAMPALAGFLCLPFVARYRRRPVALAVAAACLACASLASAIELQGSITSVATC